MTIAKSLVGRGGSLLAALAFTVATVAPVLISSSALAAGNFSPRKITLSSSAAGTVSTDANGNAVAPGSGGNGAKARHTFNFTIATAANVNSMVIQYCDNPIFTTACVTPAGLTAAGITTLPTVTGFTTATGSNPAIDTATVANTGTFFGTTPGTCSGTTPYRQNCVLLKRSTASSTAESTSAAITIVAGSGSGGVNDWVTNPSAVGTFYARITTFSDLTYATVVDQGAVAASVTDGIDITAKVQEKLNFSVAGATVAPTTSCTPLSGTTALTLGSGGVLDTATAYDVHSYWRLSTNAANGTTVLYSGDTLKTAGGANTISAANSAGALSAPGTSQFGLGMDSSDTLGGNGYLLNNMTATSPYNAASGNINAPIAASIAFNTASMTAPVQVASASSGTTVSCDTGSIRYVANVSPVTKPGVYKTTINYIAVPLF